MKLCCNTIPYLYNQNGFSKENLFQDFIKFGMTWSNTLFRATSDTARYICSKSRPICLTYGDGTQDSSQNHSSKIFRFMEAICHIFLRNLAFLMEKPSLSIEKLGILIKNPSFSMWNPGFDKKTKYFKFKNQVF